ncbi:MAG: histidine ammonia-lyase [Planctomycetota bacterium]
MAKKIKLDGRSLLLEDLEPVLRGEPLDLDLTREARAAVKRARKVVDDAVSRGDVVYGLTTGFGKLKSVAIAAEDLEELQRNLVLSHCCGMGAPLPFDEVRAIMCLRINGLSRGHSGVRLELLEKWIRLFDAGFTPVVPQQGSVGASGDLAPLSHLAAATMGVGDAAIFDGKGGFKVSSAKAALKKIGEEPVVLGAKEGLALINGTEVMKGIGALALLRARNLSKAADAIAALSIEALFGSAKPFDARLADLKNNAAHGRVAHNVRALLAGSQVLESHKACDRVQDPYSLRCVPQIHGAFKTALEHAESVFAGELNSVTDNPILFPETGEVVSAGQFHGQPISVVLDYLAIATCTIANVSERRVEQLVNPDLSRLPAFLTPKPGLNSGLMIAQVAAASLASENKSLAHPASVDTVPTSANQEDHVSMGTTAARKLRAILDNTEHVLAIELLCAAQGRDFHPEYRAGKGAQAAHDVLRARVSTLARDRYHAKDIAEARLLIRSGALVDAVEKAMREPLLA